MKREIITTSDGSTTIHIPEWNEQYHSKHGAVQEAYHVFIESGLFHFISQFNKTPIQILEIGFGMGISAGYIQSQSISSHTIIENHPDVIPKAQEWASGKSNVTIITGSWYDVKDNLSTYDGIFYDTYGDTNMNNFSSIY